MAKSWLIVLMSAEKIIYNKQNTSTIIPDVKSASKFSGRVDINHLMARARKVKDKESKTNLVFFGLFTVLIMIVGLLLSL
tara:strand:- start:224 stop:463 length:240 start_codon:yes stop_codon:yes gene_type:complete